MTNLEPLTPHVFILSIKVKKHNSKKCKNKQDFFCKTFALKPE
jgi:hypothetical protein